MPGCCDHIRNDEATDAEEAGWLVAARGLWTSLDFAPCQAELSLFLTFVLVGEASCAHFLLIHEVSRHSWDSRWHTPIVELSSQSVSMSVSCKMDQTCFAAIFR